MDVNVPATGRSRELSAANDSVSKDYTVYVVVTNRDVFLKRCVESFRQFYPSIKIGLLDNSGAGQFRQLGESLGLEVHATDRIRSVTENQNWILDNCRTKYFVFTADDIHFLRHGFLEDSVALHNKGFELVSLGVDDACAFSMLANPQPRIGRFNTQLLGKELTDGDIKIRSVATYGFLPCVGGYWRYTPAGWESRYIHHPHDKPDVNRFLMEKGLSRTQVLNEKPINIYTRIAKMLRRRAAVTAGAWLYNYGTVLLRRGLPSPVFDIRRRLTSIKWKQGRVLSIGQHPRHFFWPSYLARFVGAPPKLEKIIVEKCEAYQPFLEKKFTANKGYKVIIDDVLNIQELLGRKSVDLTVWYHGPEHLDRELALEAVRQLEDVTGGLILIGTPLGFHQQGTDDSFKKILNAYDIHVSGWEPSEFEKLGYQTHISRLRIPEFLAWKYT
jgi:hypothetical protein